MALPAVPSDREFAALVRTELADADRAWLLVVDRSPVLNRAWVVGLAASPRDVDLARDLAGRMQTCGRSLLDGTLAFLGTQPGAPPPPLPGTCEFYSAIRGVGRRHRAAPSGEAAPAGKGAPSSQGAPAPQTRV